MGRKKKHAAHENHERWLVSYADFITLLFAFFVVMFASSQTDKGKAQQISDSVREALSKGGVTAMVQSVLGGTVGDVGQGNSQMRGPGGVDKSKKPREHTGEPEIPVELPQVMVFLVRELQADIQQGKLDVSMQPRGLVVSFREAALFPSGEDTFVPGSHASIEKVALVLSKLNNHVRLEGHTDSVPIRNQRFRSNWELSAARSIALLHLLNSKFAVPPDRLSVAGYADKAPVAPNETDAGRTRNRRVDIVVLNELGMSAEPNAPIEPAEPPPAANAKAGKTH